MAMTKPYENHVLAEITKEGEIYRTEPIDEKEFNRLTERRGLAYGIVAYHSFGDFSWKRIMSLPLSKKNLLYRQKIWGMTNQTPRLSELVQCQNPGEVVNWFSRLNHQNWKKMTRKRREKFDQKVIYCMLFLIRYCVENDLILKQDGRGNYYFFYS